ncbi:MAG TPA: type II secretion system protein [Tepidisphaeraceae bacterium]|nr:type II secretion system protein [Tepidisphaeraceae bacterium]
MAGRAGCRRAFTLIEILIVVVILSILATIVIPKFSHATETAKQNTLKDALRFLRTQIIVYRAQHLDVAPGYPPGSSAAPATQANFLNEMLQYTDADGYNNATYTDRYQFGPYLAQMPNNPINNLNTIMIVADGAAFPTPDGTTGFIYQPQTETIEPNLVGTDTDGIAYSSY